MDKLSQAQKDLIAKPLPPEAVTQHPTKTYLSSIKAIYVTERLNEVFGFGGWKLKVKKEENGERGMIVVHVTFEVPEYGFYYECFGGNDNGGETSKNFDLGDAYKGATTDAITKIASWIGIGAEVFKGKQKGGNKAPSKETTTVETPTGGTKEVSWTSPDENCPSCGTKNNTRTGTTKTGKPYELADCGACAIRYFVNRKTLPKKIPYQSFDE